EKRKVRGSLRGRCWAFIDAMDVLRRHVTSLKEAWGDAIPDTVDAIPQMAMVFPSTAGGRARQKNGSMGAVSGAPLTVTTDTKYIIPDLSMWTVQKLLLKFLETWSSLDTKIKNYHVKLHAKSIPNPRSE